MTFDPSQLPEYVSVSKALGRNVTSFEYVGLRLDAAGAIAMGDVFWPAMTEHGALAGAVLLDAHVGRDTVANWKDVAASGPRAVERAVNELHLWDLFDPAADGVSEEAYDALAVMIARSWRAALCSKFPELRFVVEVLPDGESYGPTVVFYRDE